ncbi:hypothetical protein BD560DRAFT_471948 [Blakeslea trispora]|nr:hypothetical protein BD560DRAFT_471948 [Blakeslea trispora]
MSLLILDKESKEQLAEMNTKAAPLFTGSGLYQDPLKFLEKFNKAARWNNWCQEDRKKEIFILCFEGAAERWVSNLKYKDHEKFKLLPFDDGTENSIIGQFKKKFVTEQWREIYLKQYEEYRQGHHETPLEYLENKRFLLQRACLVANDKSDKQQVRDVLNGLDPKVYQFCDQAMKDPYRSEIREDVKNLDGLKKLLVWAEAFQTDHLVQPPTTTFVQTEKSVCSVMTNVNKEKASVSPKDVDPFQQKVLNSLETLQNDIMTIRDRVTALKKNSVNKTIKCANCHEQGHFKKNCTKPCKYCHTNSHKPYECPKFKKQNHSQVNCVGATSDDEQDFQ